MAAPATLPAAEWTQVQSSVQGNIFDFAILSATQVWACTSSGYIYFFNGDTMAVQTNLSQEITNHLYGSHAVGSEHVWAAGYSLSPPAALVFHYNGIQWSEQLVATNNGITQFNDVYASDTEHIWAAGNSAQIWYSGDAGTTWTTQYNHANNKFWRAIDGAVAPMVLFYAAKMEHGRTSHPFQKRRRTVLCAVPRDSSGIEGRFKKKRLFPYS